MLSAICCTSLQAETTPGRIPAYPTDYDLAAVENSKVVRFRIKKYYESASDPTIVDSRTGERTTDFISLNQQVKPSNGFSLEWEYTQSVVLAALIVLQK